jgi:hypothetical protein
VGVIAPGPRPRARPDGEPEERALSTEERAALGLLVALHAALVAALATAAWTLVKYWPALQLPPWQKAAFQVGIGVAIVFFAARGTRLLLRLLRGTR